MQNNKKAAIIISVNRLTNSKIAAILHLLLDLAIIWRSSPMAYKVTTRSQFLTILIFFQFKGAVLTWSSTPSTVISPMRLTRYQPEPPSAASYNYKQDSCHHCQPCFQLTEGLGCDVYIEATGAGPSVKWVEKQL